MAGSCDGINCTFHENTHNTLEKRFLPAPNPKVTHVIRPRQQ